MTIDGGTTLALTDEEFQAQLESGKGSYTPVDAPNFYITAINIAPSSNSFSLLLSKLRPVVVEIAGQQAQAGRLDPVAVVDMSPGTAKDLLILLKNSIATHEAEFGEIVTEYSRRIAGQ